MSAALQLPTSGLAAHAYPAWSLASLSAVQGALGVGGDGEPARAVGHKQGRDIRPRQNRAAIVQGVAAKGGAKGNRSDNDPVEAARIDREREKDREQERKLCEQAKGGDKSALATLLRKHGPTLFRTVLLPRLGSEAAAQDALADTYMRVLERFGQFEWRGCGIYPWLRVIAMRIALDALRSKKRETLFDPADLTRAVDAAERDLHEGIDERLCSRRDRAAARDKLDRALATINKRYASAIRLRVLQEKSREEAAEELGVSIPTFDVVLHRALASLKKTIRAQEAEA